MQAYSTDIIDVAKKIIALIQKNGRVLHAKTKCRHDAFHACFNVHLEKITAQIKKESRITFILPAFPAKSPNSHKTASTLPDMGERLALQFLNQLCITIQSFYPPGAEIIICSDGRVFNDLIKVNDSHVDAYAKEISNFIEEDLLNNIKMFSLDEIYSDLNYKSMREALVATYGESLEVIKDNIRDDVTALALFNGIHRFIFEDSMNLIPNVSKNKIRLLSKTIAYHVIQRSNAWGHYLETRFPDAVRLSIHPQPCGSKKLGIMLLKSDNIWATPWHRIALFNGSDHVLLKKSEAENIGAKPVFVNDKFSHYVI